MYKRILVPIDGSSTAQRGLREAIELARALKAPAHLVVLHVVEPPRQIPEASIGYDVPALTRSLREYGQGVLARAREECEAAGLTAETDQRDAEGRVADTVAERARARACDLVVMGTHGRRGASRWVLGSDAEIVARHSAVPVLLVRGTE
jgi:nucleotide-binding universal stress UspA family protein